MPLRAQSGQLWPGAHAQAQAPLCAIVLRPDDASCLDHDGARRRGLRLHAYCGSCALLRTAEDSEIEPREGTSRLLQPATRDKTAKVDGLKSEPLDQLLDEPLWFRVIPREENHATATILHGPFVEASSHDRVERLDDASARRQAGYHFARP